MSDLLVRRYEPDDADAVWRVHEAALRASPIEFVEDAPADADLRNVEGEYLDREGATFLVGEREGRVIATGGFRPLGEVSGSVELRRMRVHPDHQRRGYVGEMLGALERRARHRGYERAVLETNATLDAAREFYGRHGYRETGRRTVETAAGETTLVRYAKRL